jgi:hypothetical protein
MTTSLSVAVCQYLRSNKRAEMADHQRSVTLGGVGRGGSMAAEMNLVERVVM